MRKRHIFIRKMAINTQFTRKIQVVNKHEKKVIPLQSIQISCVFTHA